MENSSFLELYDNYIPALPAGNYRIETHQTLELQQATHKQADVDENKQRRIFKAKQEFTVRGPQFSLNESDIHAVFPPEFSQADYSENLCHIVFNKRTIPWERQANNTEKVPWLYLLVLGKDELNTIDDSCNEDTQFAKESTVADFMEVKSNNVIYPDITPDAGTRETDPCRYIELALPLAKSLIPAPEKLLLMSHCRKVSTRNKTDLKLKDDGMFSLCISARRPHQNATNYVHLVSIEGYYNGIKQAEKQHDTVRLLSLASWSFNSHESNGKSFDDLARALNARLLQLPHKHLANHGKSDAHEEVLRRINQGYVPLPLHALTGEDFVAWYRGPFAPYPVTPIDHFNADSASAAMIIASDHGIFDHSYSAAWQAGRNASLSDRNFAGQVFNFKKRQIQQLMLLFEREYSAHIAPDDKVDLVQLSSVQSIVKDAFAKQLTPATLAQFDAEPDPIDSEELDTDDIKQSDETNEKQLLQDFLNKAQTQEALRRNMHVALLDIEEWLSELWLLKKVPFNYCVARAALLPEESIAFFYLDANWQRALLDGALSLSMHSSLDQELYALAKNAIYDRIVQRAFETEGNVSKDGITTGILLRSELVAGWPGLTIEPIAKDGKTHLPLLRKENIGANTLLILIGGVPSQITIKEPLEGLRFVSKSCDSSEGAPLVAELDEFSSSSHLARAMQQKPGQFIYTVTEKESR